MENKKRRKRRKILFFFKQAKLICKYFLKQAVAVCREGNCGNYLQLLNSFHLLFVACRLRKNQADFNAFLLIYSILQFTCLIVYLYSVVLQMGHPKCLQTLNCVWFCSPGLSFVPQFMQTHCSLHQCKDSAVQHTLLSGLPLGTFLTSLKCECLLLAVCLILFIQFSRLWPFGQDTKEKNSCKKQRSL